MCAALSKSSIAKRISDGNLVISPLLDHRQLGPTTVDLRMGTVALMSRAGAQSHVDPHDYLLNNTSHANAEIRQQKHERFDIPFTRSFLLHPGSLILVPTLEWVVIPSDLQGVVTARSSWAREGLNIATATIVNPGYRGIITLELANFGEVPIRLYPGLRIAQIAFYSLDQHDKQKDASGLQGQFDMSFEPKAGELADKDEPFIKVAKQSASGP
ncbi:MULTISPECIES: dCTP deaminase [unclassified Duganella]|uniref:dCTP deaminase n=1 Tax=unclassified Duganella TaxID=2636909 RepID=UPI000E3569B2|nr:MULTISPECIES: dCTP deaminase [unclassified Duganella]RFP08275.1 dCTP deaminase [Duganella sp. BJB475]RFP22507.1 dCTP deaminase [Duganella sp. BJB476]